MGAMDNDDFKLYLQNIEEYVMDEDKIVTYKWLSKNLGIHVNTAKQLLYSFASEQKNKVNSTYLVGGLLKNGKGGSVQIVREEDLGKIKGEFKIVTSEHLYSVQKVKKLQDLNVLYAVDVKSKEDVDDLGNRLSSIKCSREVLRPQEEVAKLKQKTQSAAVVGNDKQWPTAKKPSEAVISKTSIATKKPIDEQDNKTGTTASKEQNDVNKKAPKKGGIAAMFAAQSSKPKKQEMKPQTAENKKGKSEQGMVRFYIHSAKTAGKSSVTSDSGVGSSSDSQESVNNVEQKSVSTSEKTVENKKPVVKKEEPKKKENETKAKSKEKKGGRGKSKKSSVDEDVEPAKKRKRIVVMSDSESDDEIFGKDEEEEDEAKACSPLPQPQQPESDEDIIPPTPEATSKKGRKRVRKMIDKTFMDEDGYMLTRKEYVFESCSESEPEEEKEKENKVEENCEKEKENSEKESATKSSPKDECKEPPAKKKAASKPKTKQASPQKTKQASIMNFFKKK